MALIYSPEYFVVPGLNNIFLFLFLQKASRGWSEKMVDLAEDSS